MMSYQVLKKESGEYQVRCGSLSIATKNADEIGKLLQWIETYPDAPPAPTPRREGSTRRKQILDCLKSAGRPLTVNEILEVVGEPRDEVRNFSSTCLLMFEKKELKRARNDNGIYVYEPR